MPDIWKGVYAHFDDVPVKGPGQADPEFVARCRERTMEALKSVAESGAIPEVTAYRRTLLPFLVSVLGSRGRRIRVLDFGGGLGNSFVQTAAAQAGAVDFEFHLVELPEICAIGRELFAGDPRVCFHEEPPNLPEGLDVVHVSSALHYIRDWKSILERLGQYRSDYFFFSDLLAGDVPTFATAQLHYDSVVPVWFFNLHEFTDAMASLGYTVVSKSTFLPTLWGTAGTQLPQEGFPREYRIGNSCNLLLVRSGGAEDAGSGPAGRDEEIQAAGSQD